MKKKGLKDLRVKEIDELKKLVSEKRKETSVIYAKVKTGQEKNLKKVKGLKKEIAQILTIIREKEIKASLKKK